MKTGAKTKDTERVKKKKKDLQPIGKQHKVAGNDDGTHEGENRNVISWPLLTEENVWKRFKGENTAGHLKKNDENKKLDTTKMGGKNEAGKEK